MVYRARDHGLFSATVGTRQRREAIIVQGEARGGYERGCRHGHRRCRSARTRLVNDTRAIALWLEGVVLAVAGGLIRWRVYRMALGDRHEIRWTIDGYLAVRLSAHHEEAAVRVMLEIARGLAPQCGIAAGDLLMSLLFCPLPGRGGGGEIA